jgi:hypothetical protein|tara:strand:- start:380 stop:625 length:246 start_codon:yes stop_codon:yes gene_type:complete
MDELALKTIISYNKRWRARKATIFVNKYIKLISEKYPKGLKDYFVVPGFEHVTRNQPIIVFNSTEDIWELRSNTLYNYSEQ